ncbi:hypothetical protein [Achromobacter xylosoxidans]|uniref:hypothetical protein n=1 Tax=Alcaligenes xylosoxydans xylosoxydans TaxID=85698 RepID=UPI0011784E97|nr:hypothetical protein [Achromobacter xylosoxidans]
MTRRNLMVLATGMVTVFVLGLPIDGKLIGLVDLKGVSPIKVWFVALVGLWYFAVRYFLDPASRKPLEAWWKQSGTHVENAVTTMLDRASPAEGQQLPHGWATGDCPPAPNAQCWLVLMQPAHGSPWTYDSTQREATAKALWRGYVQQADGTLRPGFLTEAFTVTRRVSTAMLMKSGWIATGQVFKPVWPFWEYVFPLIWAAIANYCASLAIWGHLLRSPAVAALREWIVSSAILGWLRSADPFARAIFWT